ncbi:hypothetical protein PQI07_32095 [Methylobacterium sp. 092160098-2]|uniref:hypothetical protein n=1 Tax=unclassified Methylobacterium TaxID=2615210 RepID=UPI000FBC56DA|nr:MULTISPECIES: hypothetical protein [unclassified Methylobacterium]MDE4915230.1 hypothetical protein [Methylobacterium sp. 092160098-2]RUP12774.1 MAG: hypothetical protein EKK43_20065 [Methylobacterium sp.]
MIELERVELEITRTQAGIRRSWRDLGVLNLPPDKRAAEIASIDVSQLLLVGLLVRCHELRASASN